MQICSVQAHITLFLVSFRCSDIPHADHLAESDHKQLFYGEQPGCYHIYFKGTSFSSNFGLEIWKLLGSVVRSCNSVSFSTY